MGMWNALQREKEKDKFNLMRKFFKRYLDPDMAHDKWKALNKLRNWNTLMKLAQAGDNSFNIKKRAIKRMIDNSNDDIFRAYNNLKIHAMKSRYERLNDDRMKERCSAMFKKALYGKLLLAYQKLAEWNRSQREKEERMRDLVGNAVNRIFS